MTPIEANAVLAMAGQFDGRKPDKEAAISWADALTGMRLEDCLDAVKAHYTDSRSWIMPADIRQRVTAIRKDRIERGKPFLVPPPRLDSLDGDAHTIAYQAWLAVEHERLANGGPPQPEVPHAPMPPEVRATIEKAKAEAHTDAGFSPYGTPGAAPAPSRLSPHQDSRYQES